MVRNGDRKSQLYCLKRLQRRNSYAVRLNRSIKLALQFATHRMYPFLNSSRLSTRPDNVSHDTEQDLYQLKQHSINGSLKKLATNRVLTWSRKSA
ncbi:hypothetical protein O181_027523 [Austropuccinia psidii MF-1]|uniref:Uncharacterized protein n=1 Tax=Austropuccinia psidii MF-1 TaxID=1389203 RepID=A0A9Q3H105_9BASI|nr:hypothetical protein [Austropuccinia psidii MF-1]